MTAKDRYQEIAAEITDGHEVVSSQMFGMPVLKVRGKAFAGLHGDTMTFKLPPSELEAAMKLPGGAAFEPMAGRPMGGWAQVSTASEARWKPLAEQSLAYVAAIAPKTPTRKPPARKPPKTPKRS